MRLNRRALLLASPAMFASSTLLPGPAQAQDALQDYESLTGGRVGLFAENMRTGAKLSWRADERFVMCSSFKASLAACVLAKVDRGQERLDRAISFGPADIGNFYAPVARANVGRGALTVQEMCKAAVEQSDNTCANLLLAGIGGPPAMTAFWRAIGDKISRLDHDEPQLNRSLPGDPQDTTTPRAMAANLRKFVLGDVLAPRSRTLFTGWLLGCQTGFNRLRAGLPGSWAVGDKTGNNGKDAAGDIAVAWRMPGEPLLIAVYTQGGTPTAAQIETVFTAIGRAVSARLAP